MSIIISSDDSSNSTTEYIPVLNINLPKETKSSASDNHNEVIMDLTQDDQEFANKPIPADLDSDAMFDEMFPACIVSRADSGISSGTGCSTGSLQSSESASSGFGSGTKRKETIEATVKKKTTKATERLTKKQKLAEEKAARQAVAEENKIYKPGECIKHMTVEMHPKLLEAWYCADVRREVEAIGARVSGVEDLCEEGLVMWSRDVQPRLVNRDGQMELSASRKRCDQAIYVLPASELASLVAARSLAARAQHIQTLASTSLTLLLFGVKDHIKATGRKKQNANEKPMSQLDIEMAFTDLLVSTGCDALVVNTPNELALFIAQYTKAVAEEPYKKLKRQCDEQAEFYMRGDNKKCVPVDKDGHGLARLWQQMVAILPLSSLETARTVCAKYKSPLDLYEALQSSNGVNELADVGVSRAAVPGSRSRRLGPEFSRKLKILFTEEDGNTLLD